MTARTDDYDAIVRVMRLYIDAFNDNDVSKFRQAFDENAWIFYIDAGGNLHKHLISEDFERWVTPPSWGVVGRFVSVTQVGDAAAVQLSFDSENLVAAGSIFTTCSGSTAPGRLRTRPPRTVAGEAVTKVRLREIPSGERTDTTGRNGFQERS